MKPKEKEQVKEKHGKDAIEFAVAMDGLAVFVHESNALQEISLDQLKLIYTGKAKSWSALGKP
jgi:phosphate transport system substrate-binding protein